MRAGLFGVQRPAAAFCGWLMHGVEPLFARGALLDQKTCVQISECSGRVIGKDDLTVSGF